jgi:hypothetical protein
VEPEGKKPAEEKALPAVEQRTEATPPKPDSLPEKPQEAPPAKAEAPENAPGVSSLAGTVPAPKMPDWAEEKAEPDSQTPVEEKILPAAAQRAEAAPLKPDFLPEKPEETSPGKIEVPENAPGAFFWDRKREGNPVRRPAETSSLSLRALPQRLKVLAAIAVVVSAVFGALVWGLVRQPDGAARDTLQQQALDKAEQARRAAEAEARQLREAANEAKRTREAAEAEAERQSVAASEAKRAREAAEAEAKRQSEAANEAKRAREAAEAEAKRQSEAAKEAKRAREAAEAEAKRQSEAANEAKRTREAAEAEAKRQSQAANEAKQTREVTEAEAKHQSEAAGTAESRQREAQPEAERSPAVPEAAPEKEDMAAANTVEFKIANNTASAVNVAFFDKEKHRRLDPPGDQFYDLAGNSTQSYKISCTAGQTVCYGVTMPGAGLKPFWGAGRNGRESCAGAGCCLTCAAASPLEKTLNASEARRPEPTITWKIVSKKPLSVALYSPNRRWGWPSWNQNWSVKSGENTFTVPCVEGERVCFGAWIANNTSGRYWGAGPQAEHACSNCCGICDGNTYAATLAD